MARKRTKAAPSPSGRPARVGEEIKKELGQMLTEGTVNDPRLYETLVTVTDVDISPDLKHAKVFISIFTDSTEQRANIVAGFEAATSEFRRHVGDRMRLRYVPALKFIADDTIEKGARIDALLKEIDADVPSGD